MTTTFYGKEFDTVGEENEKLLDAALVAYQESFTYTSECCAAESTRLISPNTFRCENCDSLTRSVITMAEARDLLAFFAADLLTNTKKKQSKENT
tara:strand:+ start:22327 stop:22611 length:285 start_codon:yes stop_codon:yes gene_type:complete